MQRVVVTGLGLISPLGLDMETSWDGLVNGKSGVRQICHFDTSKLKVKIAAQLPEGFEELVGKKVKKRLQKQMTRSVAMNFVTALMAVEDAGLDFSALTPDRCGVIIGASGTDYPSADMASIEEYDNARVVKSMSNAFPAWICLHYGLSGPSLTVGTACSSAGYAMGTAHDFISLGLCDVMIVGGASCSILPEFMTGFGDMMALSERDVLPEYASCPFDQKRDGFVMGEGSGVLILESEQLARKRGARIYAELKRPALLGEAYNIVSPEVGGKGMARCIQTALRQAGLNPQDVDYINAHGTSTPLNDLYETQAIKQVFGDYAYRMPVSSTKSMTGHCLAAAGGVEAVISCLTLDRGVIPPTINLSDPDPELDLDYVPNDAREKSVKTVLSNSFAFGGHNAVVPFVKYA